MKRKKRNLTKLGWLSFLCLFFATAIGIGFAKAAEGDSDSTNLWENATLSAGKIYFAKGENWEVIYANQGDDAEKSTTTFDLNLDNNNIAYTIPNGVGNIPWQAQVAINSNISLDKDKKYDFSCKLYISGENAQKTITFKVYRTGVDGDFLGTTDQQTITIGASNEIKIENVSFNDNGDVSILLDTPDLGNSNITISDIVLKEHASAQGGGNEGGDQNGIEYTGSYKGSVGDNAYVLNYTVIYNESTKGISVKGLYTWENGKPEGLDENNQYILIDGAQVDSTTPGTFCVVPDRTYENGATVKIQFKQAYSGGDLMPEITYVVGSTASGENPGGGDDDNKATEITSLYLLSDNSQISNFPSDISDGWHYPENYASPVTAKSVDGKFVFENIVATGRAELHFLVNNIDASIRLCADSKANSLQEGWESLKFVPLSGNPVESYFIYNSDANFFPNFIIENGGTYNITVDPTGDNAKNPLVSIKEVSSTEEPAEVTYRLAYQLTQDLTKKDDVYTWTGVLTTGVAFNIEKVQGNTITKYGPETTDENAHHISDVTTVNCVEGSNDYWDLTGDFINKYTGKQTTFTFDPEAKTLEISVEGGITEPDPEYNHDPITTLYIAGNGNNSEKPEGESKSAVSFKVNGTSLDWWNKETAPYATVAEGSSIITFNEVVVEGGEARFKLYTDNNNASWTSDAVCAKDYNGVDLSKNSPYKATRSNQAEYDFILPEGTYTISIDVANPDEPEVTVEKEDESGIPAPPTPTQDPNDVLSLFSSHYTPATGVWVEAYGGNTQNEKIEIKKNDVYHFTKFNWTFFVWNSGNIDISGYDYMHVDYYPVKATNFSFFPVPANDNKKETKREYVLNQWNSYDIPLSEWSEQGVDLSTLKNVGFSQGNGTDDECYIANVYFYRIDDGTSYWMVGDVFLDDVTEKQMSRGNNGYVLTSTHKAGTFHIEKRNSDGSVEYYGVEDPADTSKRNVTRLATRYPGVVIAESQKESNAWAFGADWNNDELIFTFHPDTYEFSATRAYNAQNPNDFIPILEFWEGNMSKFYFDGKGGNGNFVYDDANSDPDHEYYVYRYDITRNGDTDLETKLGKLVEEKYVIQLNFFLGGAQNEILCFDAHSVNTLVDLIPQKQFWCQNSRMEPGLPVKTFFFIYDKQNNKRYMMLSPDGEYYATDFKQKPLNSDTYTIQLSNGALYDALKGTQTKTITIPFIKHHIAKEGYSINLGKAITVSADETFDFFVNGKPVSTHFRLNGVYKNGDDLRDENGELLKPYPYHVNDVTNHIDGSKNALTFNKIVLLVSDLDENKPGTFDSYEMWLVNSNEEPTSFFEFGYEIDYNENDDFAKDKDGNRIQNNPKLKIWSGGQSDWKTLYSTTGSKSVEWKEQSGNVFLYEFKPVLSEVSKGLVGKKTNIYYLDLYNGGNGIVVRNKWTDNDGLRVHMFNILDNEGYDISNPFQGSQVIYPEEWWCINPSLGFLNAEDVQKELGVAYDPSRTQVHYDEIEQKENTFYFPPLDPVVKGMSEVDLAWGVRDNTPNVVTDNFGNYVTIYGVTMFKIMGSGYDVYAENIKERPLYYLYAHTTKPDGIDDETGMPYKLDGEKKVDFFEQTCPILLGVKDPTIFGADYAQKLTVFDNPGDRALLEPDRTYFELTLSSTQLPGNDDLNYVLRAHDGSETHVTFVPKDEDAFQFMDVNGMQTWDTYSENDRLSANTWSNYYSTVEELVDQKNEDSNELTIDHPELSYFRLVLATNPDAVRYQILSRETRIEAYNHLRYHDQSKDYSDNTTEFEGLTKTTHDPDQIWIYPTTELRSSFFWDEATKAVTIKLKSSMDNNASVEPTIATIGRVESTAVEGDATKKIITVYDIEGNAIASQKIKAQDKNDAFLYDNEYIFTYDLGEFFVDPKSWSNMSATVSYGDQNEPTDIDIITLPAPAVEKVSVRRTDDFNQKPIYMQKQDAYYAQLEWLNDKEYEDLPRTYTLEAQTIELNNKNASYDKKNLKLNGEELVGELSHDGYIRADGNNKWFNVHGSPDYWYFDHDKSTSPFITSFEFDADAAIGDGTDNTQIKINYEVTPVYHYALPVSNEQIFWIPASYEERFKTAPTGEKGVMPAASQNGPRKVLGVDTDYTAAHFYAYTPEVATKSTEVEFTSDDVATGIDGVTVETVEFDGPVEIYTLQGVKVNGQPEPGIYIIRQGSKSYKTVIK